MKAILRDFPEELETERLTIRAPRPGDGAEMSRALHESWAELQEWMPWAQGSPPAEADSEARLREGRARFLTREDLWLLSSSKGRGRSSAAAACTASTGTCPASRLVTGCGHPMPARGTSPRRSVVLLPSPLTFWERDGWRYAAIARTCAARR